MSVTRPVVGVRPPARAPFDDPAEAPLRGVGPFVVRAVGRGRATDLATERGIR